MAFKCAKPRVATMDPKGGRAYECSGKGAPSKKEVTKERGSHQKTRGEKKKRGSHNEEKPLKKKEKRTEDYSKRRGELKGGFWGRTYCERFGGGRRSSNLNFQGRLAASKRALAEVERKKTGGAPEPVSKSRPIQSKRGEIV